MYRGKGFVIILGVAVVLLIVVLNRNLTPQDILARFDAYKIYGKCISQKYREQCYAKRFYWLTQKTSLLHSVSVLSELQVIDPKNAIGCHFISHKISQAETEKDPDRWEELLAKLNFDKCTGGFLHGVIEAHLATDPDFTINKDSADFICNRVVKDAYSNKRSCFHIMGHLLLFQTNANQRQAVDSCELFPDGMPEYECLSGAFMENLTREYLIAHGLAERLSWTLENARKIEKLCNEYEGLPQKACWKEISYMYWSIYETDQNKLFEACNLAPTEEMADECFIYGAGNMISSYRFDSKRLPQVCEVFETSDPNYKRCTAQLLGSLMNSSTKNLEKAKYLCDNIPEKDFCLNLLDRLSDNLLTKKAY